MNRWALIAGYQLTGLALAVSENLQRASVLPLEYRVTLKHTFVMLLAAGTVLGVVRVALRG